MWRMDERTRGLGSWLERGSTDPETALPIAPSWHERPFLLRSWRDALAAMRPLRVRGYVLDC